jgi:hypothetical protein
MRGGYQHQDRVASSTSSWETNSEAKHEIGSFRSAVTVSVASVQPTSSSAVAIASQRQFEKRCVVSGGDLADLQAVALETSCMFKYARSQCKIA